MNKKTYLLGVDEAGRGPVLGPLVMAAASIAQQDKKELQRLGITDSKLLTPKKREEIYEKLITLPSLHYEIISIYPPEIDAILRSENDTLNSLEAKKTAEILATLLLTQTKKESNAKENVVADIMLDCPEKNTERYAEQVHGYIKEQVAEKADELPTLALEAEHKADYTYEIVGAASILAKVTRDRWITKYEETHNVHIGSGYPADPYTKKFLSESATDTAHADLFRKTWETYKKIIEAQSQKNLFDF